MTKWQRFCQIVVATKNYIKAVMNDYGLEMLLFICSLGNAVVLHQYLLKTGSDPSWQLTAAIYATEILIVWASLWGTVGMLISTVLFLVSLSAIRHTYGEQWFGHSGFSLAIFCGAIGNYWRRGAIKELMKVYHFFRRTEQPISWGQVHDLTGMTLADIRTKFGVTMTHANILKSLFVNGIEVNDLMVERTKC